MSNSNRESISQSSSSPSSTSSSSSGTSNNSKRYTMDFKKTLGVANHVFKNKNHNNHHHNNNFGGPNSLLQQIISDDKNYHLQQVGEVNEGQTSEGINDVFFNVPPGKFKVQVSNTTGTGLRLFSSVVLRADVSCQSSVTSNLQNDSDQLHNSENIEKGNSWSTLVTTPMDSQQSTIRITLFCEPIDAKCTYKIQVHQIFNIVHTKGFELGKGEENNYKFDLSPGQYHIFVQSLNSQPFSCSYQLANSTSYSEDFIKDLKILPHPIVVIIEDDQQQSTNLLEVKVSSKTHKAVKAKLLILQSISEFELKRTLDSEQRVTINEFKSLIDDSYRERNVETMIGLELMLTDLYEKKGSRFQPIHAYVKAMKIHLEDSIELEKQLKDLTHIDNNLLKSNLLDNLQKQFKNLKYLTEKNKLDTKVLINLSEGEQKVIKYKEIVKKINEWKPKLKETMQNPDSKILQETLDQISDDTLLQDDCCSDIINNIMEEPSILLKRLQAVDKTKKKIKKFANEENENALQSLKPVIEDYDKLERRYIEKEYNLLVQTLEKINLRKNANKKLRESILSKQTHRIGADIKAFEPYLKGTDLLRDAKQILEDLLDNGDADVSKYLQFGDESQIPQPSPIQQNVITTVNTKISLAKLPLQTNKDDLLNSLLAEDDGLLSARGENVEQGNNTIIPISTTTETQNTTSTNQEPIKKTEKEKKEELLNSILAEENDDGYEEQVTTNTAQQPITSSVNTKPKKIPTKISIPKTKKITKTSDSGKVITTIKSPMSDKHKTGSTDTQSDISELTDSDYEMSDDEDDIPKPKVSLLESIGSIYSDVLTEEDKKSSENIVSSPILIDTLFRRTPNEISKKKDNSPLNSQSPIHSVSPKEQYAPTIKTANNEKKQQEHSVTFSPQFPTPNLKKSVFSQALVLQNKKQWQEDLKLKEKSLLERFESMISKPARNTLDINNKEMVKLMMRQHKISNHPLLNQLHQEIIILINSNGGDPRNNGVITVTKFDHFVEHDIVYSTINTQSGTLSQYTAQYYDHFIKILSSVCLNRTKKKFFGMSERTFYNILYDCVSDNSLVMINDPSLRYMNTHRIHLLLEYFDSKKYAQKYQQQYQQSKDISLMEFLLDIGELVDIFNFICKYCNNYLLTVYEPTSIMVDSTHRDEFLSIVELLNQMNFCLGYTPKQVDVYAINVHLKGSVENVLQLTRATEDINKFVGSKKMLKVDDLVHIAKFARCTLCPIIERIFKQGIKFQSVMKGYYHIWSVILEMYYYLQYQLPDYVKSGLSSYITQQELIDTSGLTNEQLHYFDFVHYTLIISKSITRNELLLDRHLHFRTWMCLALNHHRLYNFISLIFKNQAILKRYYNVEASILDPHVQELILSCMNTLCEIDFQIKLDHPEMTNF